MKNFFKRLVVHPLTWSVSLFLLLPVLAFPEIIFDHQTLYWTDLSWIHYPRHIFAAEEWLARRVPLWDPYEDTGIPLLAETQVGVLYPLSVVFLSPLSPSLELSVFILIHFSLAALFALILARSLGLGWAASTVAGLCFGFGGVLMAQTPNLNIMTGAAWLPLILAAAIQTTRQRRWFIALLAGMPLALQILTAQPQIVFYTLVILAGYGAYRVIADFLADDHRRHNFRYALHTGLLFSVTILGGLLLAAPQWLPTLELQQLSVRAQERGLDFLTKTSLVPAMWLNLLLPGAFGNNVAGFKGGDPFQEVFIYLGLIPLLLAPFSWSQRRQRDVPFFWLLLLGGILMAMGRFTPLYAFVVQYLPAFDLFRIPARWLMAVNLALAILAGLGLERLRQKGLSRRAWAAMFIICLLLIGGVILIWQFQANLLAWNNEHLQHKLLSAFLNNGFNLNPLYENRLWPRRLMGLHVPAVLLVANLITSFVLFTLYAMRRIPARVFSVLLIIAISLDLIAAGGTTINPTKPAEWWQQLSGGAQFVLDHVGQARVFPLGMGSEQATVSHLGQYFPSVYRARSAGGHGSSLLLARYDTFLHKAHPVQAIQVTGTRYLLSLGQMGADVAATYPLVYSDEASFVYENKNPLPRVFIVHQAIQANTPDEALSYFQSRTIDPAQTVILEADRPVPMLSSPASPQEKSVAAITYENPQVVEISARLSHDGYLVLLDTHYPGWIAAIDGQATPIYRANYIGRAVFAPAGEHVIRFAYQPGSFKLGLGLATLVVSTLAIMAIFSLTKKS
ncbi:MAG: YfhO family protein [Anaerolineae bacterium]|nr:YfhO family protein [Anaerolineae bacterium]